MIYGEKRGNQPPGMMNWTRIPRALPGFPKTNTIQITYEWVRQKKEGTEIFSYNSYHNDILQRFLSTILKKLILD